MAVRSASALDRVLESAVAAGHVLGAVAVAADDRGVIYAGAAGKRSTSGEHAMSLDSVFWIASMTKAVTSVAAMQLVERGDLTLDDPLQDRVPELAEIQVLDSFDAVGAPILRPPKRPITLRHLMTHTSGFSYSLWNADMARYQEYTGPSDPSDRKRAFLMAPLVFDPGDRWEYGISTDWVGHVVEQLSGQSLDRYFEEHILEPLKMRDTGFALTQDQRDRRVAMYARQADGSLKDSEFRPSDDPDVFLGGGGLFSTGPDYLRFARMLLGAGELDGVRLLSRETIAEMYRNQIGELNVTPLRSSDPAWSNDADLLPGTPKKWGLACMTNTQDLPAGRAAGSQAWAGFANTYFWVDPRRRLTGVILTQILPFADQRVLEVFDEFERALYASASID